jgi:alkaline phosphatase
VARKIDEALGGGDLTTDAVIAGVDDWWGLELSQAQAQEIIDLIPVAGSLNYAIATVVSRDFTVFGWTTYGHTGEDVPIWSYGPYRMVGGFDNTRVAKRIAWAFGFSLDLLNELLFVDIAEYFPDYEMDLTDPENPVVRVGDCSLPVSKDYMEIGGLMNTTIPLPGLTVHAPMTGKCYTSLTAIAVMQAINGASFPVVASQVQSRLDFLAEQLGFKTDLTTVSR